MTERVARRIVATYGSDPPHNHAPRGPAAGWVGAGVLALALAGACTPAPSGGQDPPPTDAGEGQALCLTILHDSDGESALLPDAGAGGAARLVSLAARERAAARRRAPGCAAADAVTLSAGDNMVAGPTLSESIAKGGPFYEALALRRLDLDAATVGNHEFELGPQVAADFLRGFDGRTPFVATNLDAAQEPALAPLADDGTLVRSAVVERGGRRIGILGVVTPALPAIASPGAVSVDGDLAAVVGAEAAQLRAEGVKIVVLLSHLQGLDNDKTLIGELSDIDAVVSGGSGAVLGDASDALREDDVARLSGPYPVPVRDRDGVEVPLVTVPGGYRYLGRLKLLLDVDGVVTGVAQESSLLQVTGDGPDAVEADPDVIRAVDEPLARALDALHEQVLATSGVPLDGVDPNVRQTETNLGDLLADALLARARELAGERGLPRPDVALQSSRGIRNDTVLPPGDFTAFDAGAVAAFADELAVVPAVGARQLRELLEHAYAKLPAPHARFVQIAGMRVVVDTSAPAGQRVQRVITDDGEVLVDGGRVSPEAPDVAVATGAFLARGGDQFAFPAGAVSLGETYRAALEDYVRTQLGGRIDARRYPDGGDGRITLR